VGWRRQCLTNAKFTTVRTAIAGGCVLKKPGEFAFYIKPTVHRAERPQSWEIADFISEGKAGPEHRAFIRMLGELAKVN
jgi:hypothetical protein